MKHVAIYLTNTDNSEFAARHPSDAEKVMHALNAVGADFRYTILDVTRGAFPADPLAFDAVILTGSPAYVDDGDAWIARLLDDIRKIEAARVPLVGLCFGHQAIVAALGGEVRRKGAWIFGAAALSVTATRRWMGDAPATIRLYAANSAQAVRLPDGMDLLGTSPDCPVAMACLGEHVFTTQFHPEMSDDFIAALVAEYRDYLGPEVADRAGDSLKGGADSALFMAWVRDFIAMERG
ncbi:MAG: type 1 glutamine amidotransferase [Rhodobacteraceae bacterium]|nr:type 1 glutamine amidotransferase [Paracoccaceae bacterium]